VVGPWIDAFFAEFLLGVLPTSTQLRVLTRPPSGADAGFAEHAIAARVCLETRPGTIIKLLNNLHAKVVVIDEGTVYCGSANWYRYSLEESREIVLRGSFENAPGLLDEIQVLWEQAVQGALSERPANTTAMTKGYTQEVIDPVAQAKLKEVPGSFVIGRSRRRR
jgi:hypothetical protein